MPHKKRKSCGKEYEPENKYRPRLNKSMEGISEQLGASESYNDSENDKWPNLHKSLYAV